MHKYNDNHQAVNMSTPQKTPTSTLKNAFQQYSKLEVIFVSTWIN